jgi:hypothetical protein
MGTTFLKTSRLAPSAFQVTAPGGKLAVFLG